MTDIKELRRLAEAATPEQWNAESIADMPGYIGFYKEDCDYIAAANPSAILSLLDKIDAQEALIAELHASIGGAVQHGEQGWQRYEAANKMCLNQQKEIAGLNGVIAEWRKYADRYQELVYAVGQKYQNETRHQTALRYIRSAETIGGEAMQSDTSTQEVG